jgi:hypothetical protein
MPPTNSYPAALNSWLNPLSGTLRNAAGYELASVITQLQQHAAAAEAKLGYAASTPGGAAAVLRRTASGQSAWGQVQGGDIATNTVTGANIAPLTITGGNLVNGTIGATQIADGGVTSAKILDQTIAVGDLAVRAVHAITMVTITNPSTSSSSLVQMAGSSLPVTATGKQGLYFVTLTGWGNVSACVANISVYDGGSISKLAFNDNLQASLYRSATAALPVALSTGPHTLSLYWSTNAGTQTANEVNLTYVEFRNNS